MRLMKKAGIIVTTSHQCMFGLQAPGPNGEIMLAKKPTQWMTNSRAMADVLSVKCDKSHDHQHFGLELDTH